MDRCEMVRQRIRYLVEHGDLAGIAQGPPRVCRTPLLVSLLVFNFLGIGITLLL